MTDRYISRKVMCACLYITVGLLVFEMAATYSFYLLEISLSVLILSFIVTLAAEQGLNPARWTAYIWEKTREVRPLVVSALAYLAVDLISTFYALSPASVLPKYKVVAVMLLVITIIVYMYEDENGTLKNIHFSVAAAGFFSALLVVLNYCFFAIYPIEYTLRLTLRSDYNMFATTIYIGSVAGSALVCSGNIRPWKKMATIILLVSVTLTVIFLSGSRRIYIAIGPTLAVLTVMCIVYMHRRSIKKRHMFLYVFGTWALCCLIITGAVGLLYSRMVETYRQQGMVGASGVLGHAETSVSQRYETLSNQSLWSKRAVLWRIASEEISGYSASELAFGRGNGYNIILYDREDERLIRLYPDEQKRRGMLSAHSMLLADLLDGGVMKLMALLIMLTVLGCYMTKFLLCDFVRAVPYLLILGCSVMGSMISNRYGLLYDKYFYLFAAMMGLEIGRIRKRKDEWTA